MKQGNSLITKSSRCLPNSYSPSAASTLRLNLGEGNLHYVTMPAGNITLEVVGEKAGHIFIVRLLQDGVGSRTVTWFTTIKWAGGVAPTLTTTAGKADLFIFNTMGEGAFDGFIVGQNI